MPQQTIQKKHQFRDDLTWNRGNHGFKFGGDFTYVPTLGGLFAFNSAPEYDFNFDADEIANNPGQFPQGFRTHQVLPGPITCRRFVGDADCARRLTSPVSASWRRSILSGGDPSFNLRDGAKQFAVYVQDDWKITPRFTLNLGVRYDVDYGFVDNAPRGREPRLPGAADHRQPVRRSKVVEDDKNNFSPRIGFAWDFRGNGRSVLRGGYGIYLRPVVPERAALRGATGEPGDLRHFLNDGPNLGIDSPPPAVPRPLTNPLPGTRGRMLDPDFESPYTQQWNIGFAQELGSNMALEFDYVHILGLHEFTWSRHQSAHRTAASTRSASDAELPSRRILTPQFAAHAAELTAAFGTPTPFGRITVAQSDGRSRYDAFTASFKKRYANKYQLNAHYTLAKSQAWFGTCSGLRPPAAEPVQQI